MPGIRARPAPRPGQLWLSCPPYLLLASVVEVDRDRQPATVSFRLHDDDGSVLEQVNHAVLDDGWWKTFKPLVRRFG